jgi:hypothetical protein
MESGGPQRDKEGCALNLVLGTLLLLPQPPVQGQSFLQKYGEWRRDRFWCKSEDVTQKPISRLEQLTSCIKFPTNLHHSLQSETLLTPSLLMPHIHSFTMICPFYLPK